VRLNARAASREPADRLRDEARLLLAHVLKIGRSTIVAATRSVSGRGPFPNPLVRLVRLGRQRVVDHRMDAALLQEGHQLVASVEALRTKCNRDWLPDRCRNSKPLQASGQIATLQPSPLLL
jgi:hypothetical protein